MRSCMHKPRSTMTRATHQEYYLAAHSEARVNYLFFEFTYIQNLTITTIAAAITIHTTQTPKTRKEEREKNSTGCLQRRRSPTDRDLYLFFFLLFMAKNSLESIKNFECL